MLDAAEGLRTIRAGSFLSGLAVCILAVPPILAHPSVYRYLPPVRVSWGLGVMIIVGSLMATALLGATAIGKVSLATQVASAHRGRFLARLSGLPPVALAALLPFGFVVGLGVAQSPSWYWLYLFFLPSGIVVAAHLASVQASILWTKSGPPPLPLTLPALVGSTGLTLLPLNLYSQFSQGAFLLVLLLSAIALLADIALMAWSFRASRFRPAGS